MVSGTFKAGDELNTVSGEVHCQVEAMLGAGGQGEVYRVRTKNSSLALKWYYPHMASQNQYEALHTIIGTGAPDRRFVWPIAIAQSTVHDGFGYLMPLWGSNFKSIADLQARRVVPTFRVLVTVALHLADGFRLLHAKGMCYRDISHGNVVFDPSTGDILICDNDNVGPDSQVAGVVGTPKYMAPEIVVRKAVPSTQTDLYSLSVLLFIILINNHPLDGKREAAIHCFDLPAMEKLYGSDPLFIFDPYNRSNEPLPGYHDNATAFWPLYPQSLRSLFTEAFTAGLYTPNERIRESTWREALSTARDLIHYCRCGAENFADGDLCASASGASSGICWRCGRSLTLPPRLIIGKRCIMLSHDTELYAHHIDPTVRRTDLTRPIGKVRTHPSDPSVWGLQNCSQENWVIKNGDAVLTEVPPGKSMPLASGVTIQFGKAQGTVMS